jgi:hypothetical protein
MKILTIGSTQEESGQKNFKRFEEFSLHNARLPFKWTFAILKKRTKCKTNWGTTRIYV